MPDTVKDSFNRIWAKEQCLPIICEKCGEDTGEVIPPRYGEVKVVVCPKCSADGKMTIQMTAAWYPPTLLGDQTK